MCSLEASVRQARSVVCAMSHIGDKAESGRIDLELQEGTQRVAVRSPGWARSREGAWRPPDQTTIGGGFAAKFRSEIRAVIPCAPSACAAQVATSLRSECLCNPSVQLAVTCESALWRVVSLSTSRVCIMQWVTDAATGQPMAAANSNIVMRSGCMTGNTRLYCGSESWVRQVRSRETIESPAGGRPKPCDVLRRRTLLRGVVAQLSRAPDS